MTISGAIPEDELIPDIEFLPANSAQAYIANLERVLAELDGAPVFLVHDMETGTSDIAVADLENALIGGEEIAYLPLFKVLKACFKHKVNFRIWWADNDDEAYTGNSEAVLDIESALNSIRLGKGAYWHHS
ncbi:MAG: hypothetical protein FPO08_19240 [Geobacter sp.]|nr:MAG: hypothetical protein FPO08_19240 [Geobacter sp.]